MITLAKIKLDNNEIKAVIGVLKSGQLSQGEKVTELEQKFAKLCGVKYAVAVNSGTAALHCALYACGLKQGDEVITTPFTFVASANPILMAGAKPVFVDIDEKTLNLDPNKIESAITNTTKAIITVNLYGQPADYEKINQVAKKYGLIVIEDAAQSINAHYKNRKSGNLGDTGCFSFYATKNIMCGEGGMITTNNKTFFEKARRFRHHGQKPEKKYEYFDLGYNYRMTDIAASLALTQLERVESITNKRQQIANLYNSAFKYIKQLIIPVPSKDRTHVYHQYVLRIRQNSKISRDRLKKILKVKGIETNIHYPKPLYKFPHLLSTKTPDAFFPVTQKAVNEVLSIPVHPHLTKQQLNYIVETIQEIF